MLSGERKSPTSLMLASHARADRAAWQGGRLPPLHPLTMGAAPLALDPPGRGDFAPPGPLDHPSAVWTRAQGALLPETPAPGLPRPHSHGQALRLDQLRVSTGARVRRDAIPSDTIPVRPEAARVVRQ